MPKIKIINFTAGRTKLRLKKTCAAIGIFDGVHRGHQYLIGKMLKTAKHLGARPVVITFFPHPAHVLRPDLKLGYLTSLKERFRRLAELGVRTCLVVRFDRAFAAIEPEAFIKDVLVKKLGVKAVFVGHDFRFGKERSGDAALFKKLSSIHGYEMHDIAGLRQAGAVISSTRIRQAMAAGRLNEAAKLLGRPVSVSGTVVKGARRGKGLGFATANIAYEDQLLPAQGVYIVQVVVGKKEYPAIANIGTRPSFEDQKVQLHLEVHILDFKRNIYGKDVQVDFLKKLRNEKRFKTPQALIQQIRKDEASARQYFNKHRA